MMRDTSLEVTRIPWKSLLKLIVRSNEKNTVENIGVIYTPPNTNVHEFVSKHCEIVETT